MGAWLRATNSQETPPSRSLVGAATPAQAAPISPLAQRLAALGAVQATRAGAEPVQGPRAVQATRAGAVAVQGPRAVQATRALQAPRAVQLHGRPRTAP